MKGYKEVYKSIFHYCNEYGSHENSFYIWNMHRIYFSPHESFMNILHGYKLVPLPYGVCKKKKYCNRKIGKKNPPFDKCPCSVS